MWMFWIKNLLRCGWKGIFRQQPIQVHGQSKNNTLMPIRLFLYITRILLPLLVVCAIKSRVLKMKRYNLSFVEGLLGLVGLLLVLINLNLYFYRCFGGRENNWFYYNVGDKMKYSRWNTQNYLFLFCFKAQVNYIRNQILIYISRK